MKILVTGGAGFIGSAVVRHLINNTVHHVINLDKVTYAGNLQSLVNVADSERYTFIRGDICDLNRKAYFLHQPHVVMHLAAGSTWTGRSTTRMSSFRPIL